MTKSKIINKNGYQQYYNMNFDVLQVVILPMDYKHSHMSNNYIKNPIFQVW